MTEWWRKKSIRWYDHPFIMGLSKDAQHLYDFLAYNSICNSAGLYKIALAEMTSKTHIDIDGLPDLLKELEKNIKWYPEFNIIWHKELLNNQTSKNQKFSLVKVAKDLKDIRCPSEIIREFLDYNSERYGIEIPIEEGRRPSKPAEAGAEKAGEVYIPTAPEIELLEVIKTFKGWEYQENRDLVWLRDLTAEFDNATVKNFKDCRDWFSEETKKIGAWKKTIRNWLTNEPKYKKEKGSRQPRKPDEPKTSGDENDGMEVE